MTLPGFNAADVSAALRLADADAVPSPDRSGLVELLERIAAGLESSSRPEFVGALRAIRRALPGGGSVILSDGLSDALATIAATRAEGAPARPDFMGATAGVRWKDAAGRLGMKGANRGHALRMRATRAAKLNPESPLALLVLFPMPKGRGKMTCCRADVVEWVAAALAVDEERVRAEFEAGEVSRRSRAVERARAVLPPPSDATTRRVLAGMA